MRLQGFASAEPREPHARGSEWCGLVVTQRTPSERGFQSKWLISPSWVGNAVPKNDVAGSDIERRPMPPIPPWEERDVFPDSAGVSPVIFVS